MEPEAFVTFLTVADLPRASRFYQNLIGLPLALDQGSCHILRLRPGAFLGLCEGPPLSEPEKVVLTWVVRDVAGQHRRLTAQGVATDGPPRVNPQYQIEHFYARDPEGHRLEFQRFLDPRWSP
jgi:catechol 2,3-dioxygenase-like lactoylglutathione lyase family enzyme